MSYPNSATQMNRKLDKRVVRSVAAALCFATTGLTTAAHAQPSVEGNTISWPGNAWYQVENRTTGEIVCQGGSECTVSEGIYWVSWFYPEGDIASEATRVVVGNPAANNITNEDFADYLSIEGNTITWTVGGWYQIQDANTFSDVCNGEGSCTVPSNGSYIVINHNLGLRTTVNFTGVNTTAVAGDGTDFNDDSDTDGSTDGGIVSGGESINGSTDPRAATLNPIVTGNVISWASNGFAWYQVEDRLTGEIVCAGGSSCTLPDGVYWVSWFYKQDNGLDASGSTRVELGNPETNKITRENFANYLTINGNNISWSVGGWYQVQNEQTLESICNGEDSCTVPANGQYIVINHSLGMRTTLTVN